MTAWLQTWSDTEDKPQGCKWFGQTICPRELHIKDGRILQTPVRELDAVHGKRTFHENVTVQGETSLEGIKGRVADLTVTVQPGEYRSFTLKREYYDKYFYMEDRAIERLTDLKDFWMPFVDDTTTYPIDCVFTSEELDTIDRYRADFENAVSEQEGLWLKDGGPSDDEWSAYLDTLTNSCGMDKLLEVYQNAYDRYKANV